MINLTDTTLDSLDRNALALGISDTEFTDYLADMAAMWEEHDRAEREIVEQDAREAFLALTFSTLN